MLQVSEGRPKRAGCQALCCHFAVHVAIKLMSSCAARLRCAVAAGLTLRASAAVQCMSIELTRNFGLAEFRESIKNLYM